MVDSNLSLIPPAMSSSKTWKSAFTSSSTSLPSFQGYDHVTWWVGNAKQAASYYVTRMGFRVIAYRGLETGSRTIASWVVSNGQARFVLLSPTRSEGPHPEHISEVDQQKLHEIHAHLSIHGDAVKDVAFEVDNVKSLYSNAIAEGAVSSQEPTILCDRYGELEMATIKAYGDTTHTFVDRSRYHGPFSPGYLGVTEQDPSADYLPLISYEAIDHCVGNQDWNSMEAACT